MPLDVLYEDNHLLVVNKPAGIATMGAESGPTVYSLAAHYIARAYNKPGRAFIGVVHRLDAMTSGVLVLARTSKAASRLSAQFAAEEGSGVFVPTKIYLAVLQGKLEVPEGDLVDFVCKDEAAKRMQIVSDRDPGAQEACLRYTAIGRGPDLTFIAVQLLTGRKHQIRLQFADRGHVVFGDRKYGSKRPFGSGMADSDGRDGGIALHAWQLQIQHPTKKETMTFQAPLPTSWKPFLEHIPTTDKIKATIERSFGLNNQ
jgi:23S rRNA pseudouridine1911/1915/1917 synthase